MCFCLGYLRGETKGEQKVNACVIVSMQTEWSLNSQNLSICYLTWQKGDFASVTKFKTLRWEYYPGLGG